MKRRYRTRKEWVFTVASTHRGRFTLSRPNAERPGFVHVIHQVRLFDIREV